MCATTMRIGLTSLGLAKDTPTGRPTSTCPVVESKIHSCPRLGGLHPSLRGRRLDSDNFVLSEQVSLSQSEPRGTLSPWAALVAWTNIWPGLRIVNQRAHTPGGGKLLLMS